MSRMNFFMNLSPLNTTVSRIFFFRSLIYGCEFYCRVECASLFNETFKSVNFISFTVPKGENVINETFPFSWLGIVLLN